MDILPFLRQYAQQTHSSLPETSHEREPHRDSINLPNIKLTPLAQVEPKTTMIKSDSIQWDTLMHAVEIGNERLDSGIYLMEPTTVAEKTIPLMEALLSHVTLFLRGKPLHSTLMSCHSVHLLQGTSPVLNCFIQTIFYIVSLLREGLASRGITFEEDLVLDGVRLGLDSECYVEAFEELAELIESKKLDEIVKTRCQLIHSLGCLLHATQFGSDVLLKILDSLDDTLSQLGPGSCDDVSTSFDPRLNCRYSNQVPMFDMKLPSFEETKVFFKDMVTQSRFIHSIASLPTHVVLQNMSKMMVSTPEWNILTRLITCSVLIPLSVPNLNDPIGTVLEWMESLKPCGVKLLMHDSNQSTARHMHIIAQVMEQAMTVFCMNKGRQRRRIRHVLLDLETLHIQAIELDSFIHSPEDAIDIRSTFLYKVKLEFLILYYQFGFELELYTRIDYPIVFYTLSHLFDSLATVLTQMHRLQDPESLITQLTLNPSGIPLLAKIQSAQASSRFYSGLFHVTRSLSKLKWMPDLSNGIFNPKVHYDRRCSVLIEITLPRYTTFETYSAKVSSSDPLGKITTESKESFESCIESCQNVLDHLAPLTKDSLVLTLEKETKFQMDACVDSIKSLSNLSSTSEFKCKYPFFPYIE